MALILLFLHSIDTHDPKELITRVHHLWFRKGLHFQGFRHYYQAFKIMELYFINCIYEHNQSYSY